MASTMIKRGMEMKFLRLCLTHTAVFRLLSNHAAKAVSEKATPLRWYEVYESWAPLNKMNDPDITVTRNGKKVA